MIKEGLLVYNKRSGFTSNDELSIIKKILGIKSCGHSGTLDKNASGLLLVFLEKSTKFARFFIGLDKRYIAEIKFGEQRTTDDSNGEIVNKFDGEISFDIIKEKLKLFYGKIYQVPPNFSAIHINGKRAYQIARSGENPDLKKREIEIKDINILDFSDNILKLDIKCSSGTYIRSIARDLGLETGYYAYLKELERVEIGDFSIRDAYNIEQLKNNEYKLLKPEFFIPYCKKIEIQDEKLYKKLSNGINIKNIENFILKDKAYPDGLYSFFYNNALVTVIEKKAQFFKYIMVKNDK